ncbi:MAG: acetate uptake transporter [Candidatus Accumulibacter sp.]|nr:acetate uptake transporter [Accumulibacter sp.]
MSDSIERKVQIEVADPSAVGLLGLAVVTAVASSQKLGVTTGTAFVIPWAIFLGAMAQLYASAYDFNHKNLFGATVFGAFGFFWLGVAMSWIIASGAFGPELKAAVDGRQIGYAFLIYFLFAVAGTIAATATNLTLFIDMVFIDLLLLGLTVDSIGGGVHWAHGMAAYAEVATSAVSIYACCATFLNKFFGRPFWPMGAAPNFFKK